MEPVEVDIAGDVVERQELLNGMQILTLEGASDDGAWTLVGGLSWNIGLRALPPEGDITLSHNGGDELFGTLARGEVHEAEAADEADYAFALEYEVDGGEGVYAGASGRLRVEGVLFGDAFRVSVRLG
jgi:hypothetical protein